MTSEKKMLWNFQFYHDNASDCVSAGRRKKQQDAVFKASSPKSEKAPV